MIVWLVGGIDPTGGAGLHRDEATLRAFAPSVRGIAMASAHTQQGHGAPATSTAVDPAVLLGEIDAAPAPAAIKVGLVPASLAPTIATILARHDVPRVVDPVLAASDGGRMGARADALAAVLAHATVLTPNRPEAAQLCGLAPDDPHLLDVLTHRWPRAWVLLKDGHGGDPKAVHDRLGRGSERHEFVRPRRRGSDLRGTGCALATAIAAGLVLGRDVPQAVADAITWLDDARLRPTPGPDGRPHLG